jgi:hypothetical protein
MHKPKTLSLTWLDSYSEKSPIFRPNGIKAKPLNQKPIQALIIPFGEIIMPQSNKSL